MRRVPHDRAVRNIEEARPQLGNRRGLGKSSAGRHHRIQEWQTQRDSGGLQNCSATDVLLSNEHLISFYQRRAYRPLQCGTLLRRLLTGGRSPHASNHLAAAVSAPCLRKASLLTIPNTIEDSL